MHNLPIILIIADNKFIENRPYQAVNNQYIRACFEQAKIMPLILPNLYSENLEQISANLLEKIDGVLLSGAISNIHPRNYAAELAHRLCCPPYDESRDKISLRLIPEIIKKKLPLLAICRGMQELNVALGGTLQHNIQDKAGYLDHREVKSPNYDEQYVIRQKINIQSDSLLYNIIQEEEIMVNSLHSQAIDKLAPDLAIDAIAQDGIIEAVSLKNSDNFVLGVQFHPEYWAGKEQNSTKIISAFGNAIRQSRAKRA